MTTEDREVLAVDLLDLRNQARETIPQMAEIYARCTQDLHNTSHYETGAFDSTFDPNLFAPGGIALPSAVFPAWVRLRDELQSIMATTVDNLNATAQALDVIADAYAAQDETLEQELERISGDLPGQVPWHQPDRPGTERPVR